jgi:ATP-binding cassette, subfamily G (WHITE), member 2
LVVRPPLLLCCAVNGAQPARAAPAPLAQLKRPLSEGRASKAAAVNQLLGQLGLTGCADVPIGDPLAKGISGGQAKRTNIGIALISDPRVLFLDEPTSGLDSFSANEVVALVRGLSRSGVTVVATIHSPSAVAFAMFDRVLMLVRGTTAYFGPNNGKAVSLSRHP